MYTYPHTIENGAGEKLTFLGITHNEHGGDRLQGEIRAQPGSGPPMHIHHLQEEVLIVQSGKLGYQLLGEASCFGTEGEKWCLLRGSRTAGGMLGRPNCIAQAGPDRNAMNIRNQNFPEF